MNLISARQRFRDGVVEVEPSGLFETHWLQSQSGNCVTSVTALQDLAEV